uniref:Uncharacterized protein n=1 Tax=Parascaris equorum TaxID=6256 RepID=A0A914RUU9_PAREQ
MDSLGGAVPCCDGLVVSDDNVMNDRIDVPVRFAEKVSPGRRLAETVELISNVWGVIPKKNVPVYRYDVRILEEFPPNASGDARIKEVTKQCREEASAWLSDTDIRV